MITDGYQVYHKSGKEWENLTIGSYWIHARRPFAEFVESLKSSADGTIAQEAYAMLTEIMHIDNGFDNLPSTDRLSQRQLLLTGKVDANFAWIKQMFTKT